MPYVGRTPTPSPVTIDDIPANSIDASKIVDGSIEVSDIKDNSITDAKLNSTKLDGIADNANNYSHPAAHTVSEVTGLQGLLDGKTTETYVNTQVAALVASSPATLDTLNELAAALGNDPNFATTVTNSIGTKLPLAGGTMTGDVSLGDGVKANFGAGDDLQIYHSGSHSFISDQGTGNLILRADQLDITNAAWTETKAEFDTNGKVKLYYDNSPKFETTSTGIDVTGIVDASGVGKFSKPSDFWASTQAYYGGAYGSITTNGSWEYEMTCNGYRNTSTQWTSLNTNSYTGATSISMNPQGHIRFCTDANKATGSGVDITERMRIDSAGNVGIGTSSPSAFLHITGSEGSQYSGSFNNTSTQGWGLFVKGGADADDYSLRVQNKDATELLSVKSNGNVGIGTTAPSVMLDIGASGKPGEIRVTNNVYDSWILQKRRSDNTQICGIKEADSGGLAFQTNNVEKVRIQQNGNVGIGTNSPSAGRKLHINDSSTWAALRLSGAAGNFLDMKSYGNSSSGSIIEAGGDQPLRTYVNGSERMRITSTGNLVHQGNGGVEEFYAHGWGQGYTALSVDVPCDDDGSTGTVFHIEASMTHHPSYDCMLETWLSCRGTNCTNYEQFRRNTGTSGAWSVSRTSNTNLRVSKSAGSYVGAGPWWVRVTYRRA